MFCRLGLVLINSPLFEFGVHVAIKSPPTEALTKGMQVETRAGRETRACAVVACSV